MGGGVGGQGSRHGPADPPAEGVDLDPEKEAIVTIGAKDALAHLLFATVGPGKPPSPTRTVGQDAAPVIFATRWITPESTMMN
jgi:alanine-synthesizing transaminase